MNNIKQLSQAVIDKVQRAVLMSADHRELQNTLEDIPEACLRAVLQHLALQDYASLRRVSRSLAKTVTEHVPYIKLKLSDNSSTAQVYLWSQATQQLQHTTCVQIHITGKIQQEVFELAVQLLSQRCRKVTELHLLGPAAEASDERTSWSTDNLSAVSAADIHQLASLKCLRYLLADLKTLVVKGLAVQDLASDLQHLSDAVLLFQHLAIAVGLQKQTPGLVNLTLDAEWRICNRGLISRRSPGPHPSTFSETLEHLTRAMPQMETLSVRLPYLETYILAAGGSYVPVEVLAALVTTAMQLEHLKVFKVMEAPDDWPDPQWPMVTAAAAASTTADAQAPAEAGPTPIVISFAASAMPTLVAAAFTAFDDFGCWLLQYHPTLAQVHVSTVYGWSFCWKQPGHSNCTSLSSRVLPIECVESASIPEMCVVRAGLSTQLAVTMEYEDRLQQMQPVRIELPITRRSLADAITIRSRCYRSSSNWMRNLSSALTSQLSQYSLRPSASLLCHINSFQLLLSKYDVSGLTDLLSNMKSLERLEVVLWCCQMPNSAEVVVSPTQAATAVIAAAAQMQGLQYLDLQIETEEEESLVLTSRVLLPLAIAAVKKGGVMKKLKLTADFGTTAARSSDGYQWHHKLRHLVGLRELTIHHHGRNKPLLLLPASSLPASLKVLNGSRIHLIKGSAALTFGINGTPPVALKPLSMLQFCARWPLDMFSGEVVIS